MKLLPLAVGCCVIIPFSRWHHSHTSVQSQRGHRLASINAWSRLGRGQALMWQAEIIAQLCIHNQPTQTNTHTSLLDMIVVSAPTPHGGAREQQMPPLHKDGCPYCVRLVRRGSQYNEGQASLGILCVAKCPLG